MEMDNSYDEFFDAFEGVFESDDGNQTDGFEDTGEVEDQEDTQQETGEESGQEAQGEPDSGETTDEVTNQEAGEAAAEGKPGSEEPNTEQKFTIKVNKETREVGLQEITELAQKGADYDRTKGQLETSRQNEQALQAELDKQKPYMDVLTTAAEAAGIPVDQFLEQVQVNLLMGKGMTEKEAKAEIRALRAEQQVKAMTAQKPKEQEREKSTDGPDRAQTEIAEFAKNFPDVHLTEEQVNKLMPDVQAGMSLTNAYLKMENARLAAELAEQQRKESAAAQNRKNRSRAVGSQRDSGAQNHRTAEDDFFDAFEK